MIYMKGQVAQLVEQRTENPRVGGSIPPLARKYFFNYYILIKLKKFFFVNKFTI